MFKKEVITKFFKYDWNNIINDATPKNNTKSKVTEEEYNQTQNGAILKIICAIISGFLSTGIAITLATMNKFVDLTNVLGIHHNINIIGSISGAVVLPIAIFIYNILSKDKEENTYIRFIGGIIILVELLITTLNILTWIGGLFINIILAILGILVQAVSMYASILMFTSCVDYCLRSNKANSETKENTKTTKKAPKEKVSFCSQCGASIKSKDSFCSSCGNKIK